MKVASMTLEFAWAFQHGWLAIASQMSSSRMQDDDVDERHQ